MKERTGGGGTRNKNDKINCLGEEEEKRKEEDGDACQILTHYLRGAFNYSEREGRKNWYRNFSLSRGRKIQFFTIGGKRQSHIAREKSHCFAKWCSFPTNCI